MAGRSLSAHVDDEIADRVDEIAEFEGRNTSQIVGAALSLYAQLPNSARRALRRIQALGGAEGEQAIQREVAGVLLLREYEMVSNQVASEISRNDLQGLSEEEIYEKAVELTGGQEA